MAAAKSLVAAALLALAVLAAVPSAVAGGPTLKLSSADQAKAAAAVLRRSDFPIGWRGGRVRPSKLKDPSCPGFAPASDDLVVTGHVTARFRNSSAGVLVVQDTQVLESAAAVRADFGRTVVPALADCLAHQYRQRKNVVWVKVRVLELPQIGTVSGAFRAVLGVRSGGRVGRVVSDFVFVGHGRMEYSLNVVAPARFSSQLMPFELDAARLLVDRGRTTE